MRLLHSAVLATRRTPVLSAAWRAAYGSAASLCARGLAALEGVEAVVLHRGAARGPEPGVSDVDLIVLRRPLEPRAEPAWLAALGARARALRRAFPMLGDLWISESAELDAYLRLGGLRAWEDPPGWRVLSGRLPARPRYGAPENKRRWLDPWVWAFTSHMELTRRLLRPGRDLPAKRDADLRKMHADCARLCRSVLDGSPPAPRREPDGRDPETLWIESAALLAEASRAAAGACAQAAEGAPAWRASPQAETLRRALGAEAVVLDAPYHAWAVFPEDASPARLREAAGRLGAAAAGVPIAVTRTTFALVLQSSYLGAPLGGLDARPSSEAGGLFAGWGPAGSGSLGLLPRLPMPLSRAAAEEAAVWMALWWRGLWAEEAFPNRFVLYHLHGRSAALALALAGRPVPSGWPELMERAAELPGWREHARAAARFEREEPPECVERVPRAALAPEHCAALAGALRRLEQAP